MRIFIGLFVFVMLQMAVSCRAEGPVFKGMPSAQYQLDEIVGSMDWCEHLVRDFDFPNTEVSKARIFKNKSIYFLVLSQEENFKVVGYKGGIVYAVPYQMVLIRGNVLTYDGGEYVLEHSGDSYPSTHGGRGKVGAKLLNF